MPDMVEDMGGCPRGHWGVLLGRFFEGSAEDEGRGIVGDFQCEGQWLHTNEAWWGLFIVVDAGDGGGQGFVGLVD